jgi:hypothetical protein
MNWLEINKNNRWRGKGEYNSALAFSMRKK